MGRGMSAVIPIINYERQETVFSPTVGAVQLNLGMLYERMRRLCAISSREDYVEWMTYFEMIIVQLRALCCERKKCLKNFTIQGLLYRIGESEDANALDRFLDETVVGELKNERLSLRNAIKLIADKFVCHYDDYQQESGKAVFTVRDRDMVIRMLISDNMLRRVVFEIQVAVDNALVHSQERFRVKFIEHLFGSVEEYERIKAIRCPILGDE